ncbi:hypothetical protein P8C59_009583 [Phyllachora maydis]|uniref:Uncharacterized protein n=1 Tax=Phyllachora maydis TaxID=1825666 RepID=A0AAD9IEY0_9PEZI|nr:hypothetical protein P8C59_009583 [Phyllachora maydis]
MATARSTSGPVASLEFRSTIIRPISRARHPRNCLPLRRK